MNNAGRDLRSVIEKYTPLLEKADHSDWGRKPAPEKWSKKEILGHLVDSAHNNLRRFVVAQYENLPEIIYNQDFWVAANAYGEAPVQDLVLLWRLLNLRICAVLENMPEESEKRLCRTNDPGPHPISWLAQDYIRHLLHHMHQVLGLEPLPYP